MSNKYEKDFEKFKKNISKLQNDEENIDKITKLLEKQLLSQQEYKYYLKCKKYAEDVDLKKHKTQFFLNIRSCSNIPSPKK